MECEGNIEQSSTKESGGEISAVVTDNDAAGELGTIGQNSHRNQEVQTKNRY
jgi:hypothetical protein